MPVHPLRAIAVAALAVGGVACLDTGGASAPELRLGPLAQFSVTVAEFTVPLMTDACFTLKAYNTDDPAQFDAAHEVWSAPGLCASALSAPGFMLDVAATCDPTAPGAGHVNAVRLVLDDLYMGGDAGADGVVLSPDFYDNPCPAGSDDCVLTAPCDESATAQIDFNLLVTAFGDLGIYDTRVTIGDVFCAAKLDCEDHGGGTLDYLRDPRTGLDGPTAVLGFACTAGADAAGIFLYLDDLVITCDNGWTATIDPGGAPGHTSPTDPNGILFAADINRGDARLGTRFWNVLLGLNLAGLAGAGTCTLTTLGTASETALCETPEQSRYPVIRWDVDLTQDGARACGRHALNGGDGAVSTFYTPLTESLGFEQRLGDGGVVADLAAVTCGCAHGSQVFDATGADQVFVVPAGCSEVQAKLWGAGGGGSTGGGGYLHKSAGGGGGFSSGTLAVTPGQVLTIIVGQGGGGSDQNTFTPFGGGTPAWGYQGGGGGGGRSAIRVGGAEVITAGGGGGGGYGNGLVNPAPGGGTAGGTSGSTTRDGGGGTQFGGGAGGIAGSGNGVDGGPLQGGMAGYYGGGGGGGYFGGGGGAGQSGVGTGSGGGGAGYVGGVSGGSTSAGSLQSPANMVDLDYFNPIGAGGAPGAVGTWGSGLAGGAGRVIVFW